MTSEEYKEPDAHYPDGSATMRCNRCHADVWTGDDGWACSCDSGMFPYAVDLAVRAAEERGRLTGWREAGEAVESLLDDLFPHLHVEDCWYSCPKSAEGCRDVDKGDECTCGADERRARLLAAMAPKEAGADG